MHPKTVIREAHPHDFVAWEVLWEDYNAFYGRSGTTKLPADITRATWSRFFDPNEPVYAMVAERSEGLIGRTLCESFSDTYALWASSHCWFHLARIVSTSATWNTQEFGGYLVRQLHFVSAAGPVEGIGHSSDRRNIIASLPHFNNVNSNHECRRVRLW
jgi:hypothetical protein